MSSEGRSTPSDSHLNLMIQKQSCMQLAYSPLVYCVNCPLKCHFILISRNASETIQTSISSLKITPRLSQVYFGTEPISKFMLWLVCLLILTCLKCKPKQSYFQKLCTFWKYTSGIGSFTIHVYK